MTRTIAIQPDYLKTGHGPQSFSRRWWELLNRMPGFKPRLVDLYRDAPSAQLKDCSAFMWRPSGRTHLGAARRIIPALETSLGIPIFPSSLTVFFARDKIAQYHLLDAAGVPTPKTKACFTLESAIEYLETARYPLVVKLPYGALSLGVALVQDKREAIRCAEQLFDNGVKDLWQALGNPRRFPLRRLREAVAMLRGEAICNGRECGHILFQEFLPGNPFDTRITIMGRYATGFRRFNRDGDFRASGSPTRDWDPAPIPRDSVRFAFEAARQMQTPFVAVDILYDGDRPVICELNFSYLSWAVADCPGYWFFPDADDPGTIEWRDESVDPERFTLEEFLRTSGLQPEVDGADRLPARRGPVTADGGTN